MSGTHPQYGLEDQPGALPLFLYGLQWWAVTVPSIMSLGLAAARMHYGGDTAAQLLYLQKLFILNGVVVAAQILWGHGLPAVTGPASVLLIGIASSLSAGVSAIYTAIFLGGILVVVLAASGLLKAMQRIFTPRVVVSVTFLIPFTLLPAINRLVFGDPGSPFTNFLFTLAIILFIIALNQFLPGIWKATVLAVAIVLGSVVFFLFRGFPETAARVGTSPLDASTETGWFIAPHFDPGVVLAFAVCMIVLIINEISSIEAVGQQIGAGNLPARGRRGTIIMGCANILGGSVGVLGSVDYILSTGFIAATGCASRFPFLPAAGLILLCPFVPGFMGWLLLIPGTVTGAVLFYSMASQLTAGLRMVQIRQVVPTFYDGMVLAVPMMLSVMVSFLPTEATASIPSLLRPLLSNGFVMGVGAVLILEHGLSRIAPRR